MADQFCPMCGGHVVQTDIQCPSCLVVLPGAVGDLPANGTVLSDRYELVELVGIGGMGGVFRARDRQLEREVAVKVLPQSLSRSRDTVQRFVTEAKRASALDHVNVIPIYDVGRDGTHLYFVMKLLRGKSLEDVVERGAVPVPLALSIFAQLLSGLEHIHEQGLIHRDIKPGNVFVEESGRVVILDFGILRSVVGGSGVTSEGIAVGTPEFMSPEVLRGAQADARSDVFAASVVLFELLTGQSPFPTTSNGIPAQIAREATSIRQVLPHVAQAVVDVVAKGLALDATKRFQSAAEMRAAVGEVQQSIARAVQHLAEQETVAVETVPPPEPMKPQKRGAVLAIAAIGGIVVVGAVVALASAPEDSPTSALAAGPPQTAAPRSPISILPETAAPASAAPETAAPEPEDHEPAKTRTARPRPATTVAATSEPATSRVATAAAGGDLYAQGQAALAAGDWGLARRLLEQVTATRPEAFRGLGQAYERLGIRTSALGAYRQYLTRRPNASDRARIEARIAALGGSN